MNNRKIIGVVGFINSGKDTVAEYLISKGYKRESFAGVLKDIVSIVFGWDRELIEGRTNESREWREQIDSYWSNRLSIKNLTPRWVLQNWGTDVIRENFHNDIWIASLEKKLSKSNNNIVISDCRFQNEIDTIKLLGGKIIEVRRGPLPEWYSIAVSANNGSTDAIRILAKKKIHISEWDWVGTKIDNIVQNDTTLEDLYKNIDSAIFGE
jgi:hypothetical protein